MKKKLLLISSVLLITLIFWTGVQMAASNSEIVSNETSVEPVAQTLYGSLAIDENQGSSYGFSYNYTSMDEADEKALSECGDDCYIVERFTSGCAAYAADQSAGSTVYGWGKAPNGADARNRALYECQKRGGNRCVVRVWACNSR